MPDYSLANILYHLANPTAGDLGNAFFEFGASLAIWLGVYKLYIDKELKGWSVISTMFFASWGLYNLFFYPSLNQWYSALAGCFVVTANIVWISMVFYYRARAKQTARLNDFIRKAEKL